MSHSRLSPSAAGRWAQCPGSVSLCERYPGGTSEAAEEGTASHWVAEQSLTHRLPPASWIGHTAPNGLMVTEEMADGATVYVNEVNRYLAFGCTTVKVEERVQIPRVHADCWGTVDLRHWHTGNLTLDVWDYKYGFTIVDPYENYQLMCYAAGALDEMAAELNTPVGLLDQHVTVTMHIVQPRPYHAHGSHRTWSLKGSDLRGPVNRLAHAAELITLRGASAPTQTGTHCRYCDARHACPALQQASLIAIDYGALAQPQELTPEALSLELRNLQRAASLIDFRKKALEARAAALIGNGDLVPGFGLEPGTGRRSWTKSAPEVFTVGDLMGINLRAEPSAITPTEARKRGLPGEIIQQFSSIEKTGMKLVETKNTLASRVFGCTAAGE